MRPKPRRMGLCHLQYRLFKEKKEMPHLVRHDNLGGWVGLAGCYGGDKIYVAKGVDAFF